MVVEAVMEPLDKPTGATCVVNASDFDACFCVIKETGFTTVTTKMSTE